MELPGHSLIVIRRSFMCRKRSAGFLFFCAVFSFVVPGVFSSPAGTVHGKQSRMPAWPVLKQYDQNHLDRIALPLGGIGTGTVSLGGKGDLRDWEIMNRPAKGFRASPGGNRAPFFVVYAKPEGKSSMTLGLMGSVDVSEYESMEGTKPADHGIPRFRHCRFDAAYPFGRVHLSDEDMPVRIMLEAFNPLIPGDAEASGIPIAVLRYAVTNLTSGPLVAAVCGSMENFIGVDGSKAERDWKGAMVPVGAKTNRNEFRKANGFQGIFMSSDGVSPDAEQWGTIALTTDFPGLVSFRTSLSQKGWGSDLLDFWDDFSRDGELSEKESTGGDTPRASLAVKTHLEAHETKEISFYLTWHFPNRYAWSSKRVGNHYATLYKDAWDVVLKTLPKLKDLESESRRFVDAFIHSDLPAAVKESALFNLSTLRSQTCFRTEDGRFYGWEGCMDSVGCCLGSCTHVWNYEQATAFLFGELALGMREVEFGHATNEDGLMRFRVRLPLENARKIGKAAADGQMGTIMKMYRDWQFSGNDSMLKSLWPHVRKALEFCWVEGGWDADRDGVMEGCQHNTMDVEYYGPNPQMELWYLGALRAAGEMARYLGENEFSRTCRKLFQKGSAWTDKNLFNGEYYIQKIMPPKMISDVAEELRVGMGAKDLKNPDFQLGNGCLVDQLVGQFMAHICGLGYLVKPEHILAALRSILKYNFKSSLAHHFNNMRSFALGDEAGLLMASFPHGRPENPFPYFNEVMTGFEYTAAVGMLFEGMKEEGLDCIRNIRSRYDGRKRSPFDEAECGHHYARAMASWGAVPALTGFHYSGVEHSMTFKPLEGTAFWSNGSAYGTVAQEPERGKRRIILSVLHGELNLASFQLEGFGMRKFPQFLVVKAGRPVKFDVSETK